MHIEGWCDSDFAGDKDKRLSTSGIMIFLNGALISWRSKGQRNVTLSSTEAEYVALADLCCEILFVRMILENIGKTIHYPITIKIDNVGAMFLAENLTTSQRTKHIDIRHHFVKDLLQKEIIKLEFTKTLDNKSDIFTKNTSGELFAKHTKTYMISKT
jgi:hypothetical protein